MEVNYKKEHIKQFSYIIRINNSPLKTKTDNKNNRLHSVNISEKLFCVFTRNEIFLLKPCASEI